MVQQTQPLLSSTTSSSTSSTRRWSSPTSPNSLISTAVPWRSGCRRSRFRSEVLPLPRKPVSRLTVTTRRSWITAAGQRLDPRQHRRVERVDRASREPLGRRPQRAEMVDHHAPARRAGDRQPALPVGAAQAVQPEHRVGDPHPVLPVRRPPRGRGPGLVGPVLRHPEHPAQAAHRPYPRGPDVELRRHPMKPGRAPPPASRGPATNHGARSLRLLAPGEDRQKLPEEAARVGKY